MIIVISKIQIRRGTELELPGAPISTNPLTFSDSLDDGEIAFTSDTGRMFIGPDKTIGNPNFQRPIFPYQNIEVLTEFSPTNRRLFNQHIKNQDHHDFYVPTVIASGATEVNLTYAEYEGGIRVPTKLNGASVSASIEYHSFDNTGNAVQQGVVRVLGRKQDAPLINSNDSVGSGLSFAVSPFDTTNGCYYLLVSNETISDITIFVRIVSISGPTIL